MGELPCLVHHGAAGGTARVTRVALKQDVVNGGDVGLKRQEIVRFNVEISVGMDPAGDGEGLAAANLHVARGVHGKLENGDAGQLQFLKHSRRDVLRSGSVPGVSNHRVGGSEPPQTGVGGV